MKVKDIADIIEGFAPKDTALDYDNVGLLVGSAENELSGIVICVDLTAAALEAAKKTGANLIITHHPVIFTPLKAVTSDDYLADLIARAYVDGIAVYCAHTNVDRCYDNMAIRLFKELSASNVTPFIGGFGAIGEIKPMTLSALTEKVASLLEDNRAYSTGDENRLVKRIAEINGAGCDNEAVNAAILKGVDVFISADIKHHNMMQANAAGLSLISVGHYASEKAFIDIIYDSLQCHVDTLKIYKHFEGNPYN